MFDEAHVRKTVAENLAGVRASIADACEHAGREVDEVELVAVTKYAELDWVRPLLELGVRSLGESRPQQLVERAEQLEGVDWHLVGHLQRNKVRRTLPATACIHSVDGMRLLQAIDRIAGEEGLRPRVLLEVNVSGEASKDGFSVESVRASWPDVLACDHVDVAGLMTMPTFTEDPAEQRLAFRSLRELRDELKALSDGRLPLTELSMGTSHDFAAAIAEGATMIRLGRTLFRGLRDG